MVSCKFKSDEANQNARSDEFNEMIGKRFPPHVPITHRGSKVRELSRYIDGGNGIGRGRPPRFPRVYVHYTGVCGFHLDGCPTTWNAGFEYSSILAAGSNSTSMVPMLLEVNGNCQHPTNKERGRCSGSARIEEAKEVSNSLLSVYG